MNKAKRLGQYLTAAPLFLLALMFMLVPVGRLILDSFQDTKTGAIGLGSWIAIFTEKIYVLATLNSLEISMISTVIGMLISFMVAWAIKEVSKSCANNYLSMINMISNFAGLPLAYAFMTILGNAGFVVLLFKTFGVQLTDYFNLYGKEGLTLLAVYFQIPLGTLMLIPAFESVHQEWKESAKLLNASGFQFWIHIGLPMMLPSLCDTFALLFANALTAYATFVLLVVDNMPLLPVKVTYIFTGETSGLQNIGSALGVWMMIIMILVIFLCNLIKKRFYKGGR
jgi:putative spermidine/putrescine transport system permease protein